MTNIKIIKYKLWISVFSMLSFVLGIPSKDISLAPMNEICNNAIDDDLDGRIDLNDPDCICAILEPKSLIPNPSFEEANCCPSGRSQLDCSKAWIQASRATTDLLHTCDWIGWDDFPPPLPFPDGDAIVGFRDGRVSRNGNGAQPNWKEYAGACLINPMLQNTLYRMEFHLGFVNSSSSPSLNMTLFGTPDCNYLPFGGTNEYFGCPTNGDNWKRLGSVNAFNSGNGWIKLSIEFTPDENIHAIALGPPCSATSATQNTYYFLDNLVLDKLKNFQYQINLINHPCNEAFSLAVPAESDFSYQWYKDGIALIGEVDTVLSVTQEEGRYEVLIDNGESCYVSSPYLYSIPMFANEVSVTICDEEDYTFADQRISQKGQFTHTFKNRNGCDSVVTINLNVLGKIADTLVVKIFEGASYKVGNTSYKRNGEYNISLSSQDGCDSLILLYLDYYKVYIPNIFSPNGDGKNDIFNIYGGADFLGVQELSIFDRWGTLLFQNNRNDSEFVEWDGTHNGDPVKPGVYVYLAQLIMNEGTTHMVTGSLTLIQ